MHWWHWCVLNVQVHNEVKHLVNATLVERYHVDPAAKTAIDRLQISVSHTRLVLFYRVWCLYVCVSVSLHQCRNTAVVIHSIQWLVCWCRTLSLCGSLEKCASWRVAFIFINDTIHQLKVETTKSAHRAQPLQVASVPVCWLMTSHDIIGHVSDVNILYLSCISSLSVSHSRSGGCVTAPVVSRKFIMRRGSVDPV